MSLTTSASVWERPVTRPRATRLGRYPSRRATAATSSRVSVCTPYSPFNARETVDTFTPDSRATSLMVTGIDRFEDAKYNPAPPNSQTFAGVQPSQEGAGEPTPG